MASEIVFDIETIGDIKDRDSLKITIVSIYDFGTDKFQSFEETDLLNLWPIFEKAERIIGYNSESFDLPVLNRYYAGNLSLISHLDLLKVIKESSGKRYKLNDIAKATLQTEKSADGLQAQKWFEEGKVELIKKYCEQDVRITKEIYEFGRKNKMLYYPTITGEILPIAVNFDKAPIGKGGNSAQKNINLTLPL